MSRRSQGRSALRQPSGARPPRRRGAAFDDESMTRGGRHTSKLAKDVRLPTLKGVGTRRQPRVMLLEGSAALREILGEALSELGFEVRPAEARRQALEHLLDDPDPDLLVVDVVDETTEGEALLSFVVDQPELARIPFIVMTDGSEPTGPAAHAVRLAKPFDLDALRLAVLEAMTHRAERSSGPEPHQHPEA
jgi:DNA-binding NtrC family response regulator